MIKLAYLLTIALASPMLMFAAPATNVPAQNAAPKKVVNVVAQKVTEKDTQKK
ncbi:hypothetical protein H5T88_02555 [bacterium]|nr:hypothetical protein [bacterium]